MGASRAIGERGPEQRSRVRVGRTTENHEGAAGRAADRLVRARHGAPAAPASRRAPAPAPRTAAPRPDELAQAARTSAPVPAALRPDLQRTMGSSFGGVRLHAGPESTRLNSRLGSNAFTVGNDVFFRSGLPDVRRTEGTALLTHELAHTTERGGRGPEVVRRDLGFEFQYETNSIQIKQAVAQPPHAFPDAGAEKSAYDTGQRFGKGKVLLDTGDVSVQTDDSRLSDSDDIEVVTTHFPETPAGRARLATSLQELKGLVDRHDARPTATGVRSLLGSVGGTFQSTPLGDKGVVIGGWKSASTMPQVTFGLRLRDISRVVDDLEGPTGPETPQEAQEKAPGRLHLRSARTDDPSKPVPLSGDHDLLVQGSRLAKRTLAQYAGTTAGAPAGLELEGLLTIVFGYLEGVPQKTSFLKQHTPLMAKTDLARQWLMLPKPVQDFYSSRTKGRTHLERLVASAPGYGTQRLKRPFFDLALTSGVEEGVGQKKGKEWFRALTVEQWLRSFSLGERPSAFQRLREHVTQSPRTPRRRVDRLSDANFPDKPIGQQIEGYGVLGHRTDTDTTSGDDLPVFELRSPNLRLKTSEVEGWALRVFDYVSSVNAGAAQRITDGSKAPVAPPGLAPLPVPKKQPRKLAKRTSPSTVTTLADS